MTKFTNEQVEYINTVKTFFTAVGESGDNDEFTYSVYYVGDDIDQAKLSFRTNTNWDTARILCYVSGIRVKELERVAGGQWEVTKDLVEELTADIDELQNQIFEKSTQLQIILGNVKKEG